MTISTLTGLKIPPALSKINGFLGQLRTTITKEKTLQGYSDRSMALTQESIGHEPFKQSEIEIIPLLDYKFVDIATNVAPKPP
jgi:hypothetical protein